MRESKLAYLTTRNMQLENDLTAAKKHIENFRQSDLKLADTINGLRSNAQMLNSVIEQTGKDRDDWRDAFKLIMRLVK